MGIRVEDFEGETSSGPRSKCRSGGARTIPFDEREALPECSLLCSTRTGGRVVTLRGVPSNDTWRVRGA